MKKTLKQKRKQTAIYLDESNVDFIENLKFKLRRQNVSLSDIVNLAIESFKKQHLADEKTAKEPKEAKND